VVKGLNQSEADNEAVRRSEKYSPGVAVSHNSHAAVYWLDKLPLRADPRLFSTATTFRSRMVSLGWNSEINISWRKSRYF
jgi:hypothetical protein